MPRALEPQQTPSFFVRGPSPFARLVFFSALSLALIATDSRLHYLVEVRQGFVALLHPLQLVANAPFNLYHATAEFLTAHSTLISNNRELTQQSLEQGARLQKLKDLENENEHLRTLLGASQVLAQPARLGEILHMGRDPFTHKIMVNLGSRQNIIAGQAVVDGDGVIGQVTRVFPYSSEVTLITDKDLSIPVQVERNGLRAIAFGSGRDDVLDLPYLPANVDIRKGDRLITSGIDGIYPVGLGVAEVVNIERNPDSPFALISSKPIAGVKNHRQVLLVGIPKIEPSLGTVVNRSATSRTAAQKKNRKDQPASSTPPARVPANANR
ncbi:Cell shape-determining protein MreC [Methylophilaceae bacterium]|nr:Cell shape-determining protein MreC [Methylophilaceae bacterium]